MERESFEDEEVAEMLNKHFISIKVDREERPDVDAIYMSVCQAMTGHGGWPLTVIMTPDKKPFFAGTYYPKHSSRGMPGIMDILTQITELWDTKKDELISSSEKVTEAVQNSLFAHSRGEVGEDSLHRAYKAYENSFDTHYGGFGRAPKFPTPHNLSLMLRYWKWTGRQPALEMVEKTLDSMYLGGIYDHIGFGFSRYSTDLKWLVPHFEKMLYDNALLAIAYLEAYQVTGKEKFGRTARDIFTYVLRDMTSPEGGFYSAEDADSEGEEGKFYIWSPEEINEVLGKEEGGRYCETYDIAPGGNFEGKSIPNLIEKGYVNGLGDMREKLFQEREKRVHPFKDDKILTAWNGLMIAAMSFGARVLNETRYAKAAETAVGFVMKYLRREGDGRLLARYRDGETAHLAYLEDYAYLIWGLIELYQATFKQEYLTLALDLNKDMLKYFWDEQEGGLFLYGSDAETLITRPKETYDGAIPSGNSVAAVNFIRLSRLTGDLELEDRAKDMFKAFGGSVSESPTAHSHFLMAVYLQQVPGTEITIVGKPEDEATKEMLNTINSIFGPDITAVLKSEEAESGDLSKVIPVLKERNSVGGKTTAYVCKEFACHPPTTTNKELSDMLRPGTAR